VSEILKPEGSPIKYEEQSGEQESVITVEGEPCVSGRITGHCSRLPEGVRYLEQGTGNGRE